MDETWIPARWPAPAHVHAGITTRRGGASKPPVEQFNLAVHVGDEPTAVAANRQQLRAQLQLPSEPAWLNQVHGCEVVEADQVNTAAADACWTQSAGRVCAVLTADCLPLLLCDRDGSCIAAVHVGWRGLVAGVVQASISRLPVEPGQLLAWLGPCIGPAAFEVGAEVYAMCQQTLPEADIAFRDSQPGRWWAHLPALTRLALQQAGVTDCHESDSCTYSQPEIFYSYRRDGHTGRMASLIWMDEAPP